jgi:ABC-type dipeptide/oligopeptide/nickel transport system permease component
MQGVFLVASMTTIAATIILDVISGLVDPRTRRERA